MRGYCGELGGDRLGERMLIFFGIPLPSVLLNLDHPGIYSFLEGEGKQIAVGNNKVKENPFNIHYYFDPAVG